MDFRFKNSEAITYIGCTDTYDIYLSNDILGIVFIGTRIDVFVAWPTECSKAWALTTLCDRHTVYNF